MGVALLLFMDEVLCSVEKGRKRSEGRKGKEEARRWARVVIKTGLKGPKGQGDEGEQCAIILRGRGMQNKSEGGQDGRKEMEEGIRGNAKWEGDGVPNDDGCVSEMRMETTN